MSHSRHVSGDTSSARMISPSDVRPNSILKSTSRMFIFAKSALSTSLMREAMA